jgi:hypothetical protein
MGALDWIDLVKTVTLAGHCGRPLDADLTARISAGVLRAVETGRSLESCLGLPRQWRSQWRRLQREAAVGVLALRRTSDRAFAERLHRDLLRYRASARFRSDLECKTKPEGDAWFWHSIIRCNGNRVPSIAAIRSMVAKSPRLGFGQPGANPARDANSDGA